MWSRTSVNVILLIWLALAISFGNDSMSTSVRRFLKMVAVTLEDMFYQTFTDIGAFQVGCGIGFGMMAYALGDPPVVIAVLIYFAVAAFSVLVRTMSQPPYPQVPQLSTIVLLPAVLVVPTFLITAYVVMPWLVPAR